MRQQINFFVNPDCSSCSGAGIVRAHWEVNGCTFENAPTICSCIDSKLVGEVILEDGDEEIIMGRVLE